MSGHLCHGFNEALMREKNLQPVVYKPRFLFLPGIMIPNLGSHLLSLVGRQLSGDWTDLYKARLIQAGVQIALTLAGVAMILWIMLPAG